MYLQLTTVLIALIFSVISALFYLINSMRSVFYKDDTSVNYHDPDDVTIVVPVYNEDSEIFDSVIRSLSEQGSHLIVVGDGVDFPYKSIAERYNATFIRNEKRGGKRSCMVHAMEYVDTPFVMFVDSDTVVPVNGVRKLLTKFEPDVGGVGPNLSVENDGSAVAYSSEFVERSREVVLKAMSVSGSVMLLDGPCAIYRTPLVKPFILSPEFRELKVFGRRNLQGMGDDRQLTSFVIRSNYRAVKNYDVIVRTQAKSNYKSYIKQQVRWSRTGWYYFFKDLVNGTSRKGGIFYTFELIYLYVLPVVILGLSLTQVYFIAAHHVSERLFADIFSIGGIKLLLFQVLSTSVSIRFLKLLSMIVNGFGITVFGIAISTNMIRKKVRTFAFGGVALLIMFLTFFYGLLTVWKQS